MAEWVDQKTRNGDLTGMPGNLGPGLAGLCTSETRCVLILEAEKPRGDQWLYRRTDSTLLVYSDSAEITHKAVLATFRELFLLTRNVRSLFRLRATKSLLQQIQKYKLLLFMDVSLRTKWNQHMQAFLLIQYSFIFS